MQYILDIMQVIKYNQGSNRKGGNNDIVKNKKLKMARLECDMSQEDLANAVGVTRQTIGLIEAGNYNPTLKLCVAICKALNKTLNDLFWEE
ncbi:helix-turn-helix transcriptional regulator [Clostridioides difficile]|uniref:helix-turn-helix transcriptional regulator n=1 Tax=Clostridioides difficile TaxID=1496 RepID=UPI002E8E3B28|nr:helix-turn-helix transcriptional regulator [Clostridioides difficile]